MPRQTTVALGIVIVPGDPVALQLRDQDSTCPTPSPSRFSQEADSILIPATRYPAVPSFFFPRRNDPNFSCEQLKELSPWNAATASDVHKFPNRGKLEFPSASWRDHRAA
ncbi:hypothetical protein KM043_012770 [Ampulex compressa]|nr:hypothetical protein KM043_012770 [Ampulex compressa]